jgi:Pvc16 N-terminal domain
MIRTALEFIAKQLDTYMVERENDIDYKNDQVVNVQSIVAADGTLIDVDDKHVTLMLAGLEEERREGKRPVFAPTDDKQFLKLNPPIELDLFLLFVAHKKDYGTALRDLSSVISFFQANPVFDEAKYPSLNAGVLQPANKPWQLIERLSLSMHSLSFEQQNNLWAMLGSKYIPSVVFKMKMITIFETKGKEKTKRIQELTFKEN